MTEEFELSFAVEELPNSSDFDNIPAGEYIASIENASVKDTKAGDGKFISIELSIIKPSHEGRRVWDNLNIVNKSEIAENIGKARLKEYLLALGMAGIRAPEELIAGVVGVRVGIKDDKNVVKKVYCYKDFKTPPVAIVKKQSNVAVSPSADAQQTPPKRASWAG